MSAPTILFPERPSAAAPRAVAEPAHEAELRPRFTIDGSAALEQHLATICNRVAAGIRGLVPKGRLELILLGGGYGRGEGGVWRTSDGDRPYNDLEFYVFLRGNRHLNRRLYGRALHVLGQILTPQAGIDVELHIASLEELAANEVSMFSYDLVVGHRTIVGDESRLAACAHRHRNADEIPPAEATRLLMNRATGLLLAAERLRRPTFTPGDADFVARNIAKAQLGAGDAVLTLLAHYDWSVRERLRRLERLARAQREPWFDTLCRHHAQGTEFKLHPGRSAETREALAARHAEVGALCREVWLWVERHRLRQPFPTISAYAEDTGDKCPETRAWRNLLVNAKVLGPRAAAKSDWRRHPRDRVLRTLPTLLWEPEATDSPVIRAKLQRQLRTTASDFAGLVAAYRRIWEQVN